MRKTAFCFNMFRCFLISAVAGVAGAAEIAPSGTIFSYYQAVISDTDTTKVGQNYFGVERAYLTLKAKLTQEDSPYEAKADITYDVEPLDKLVSGDTTLTVKTTYVGFLKYAYGEIGGFRGVPGNLYLRLGQLPTPWITKEENLWGFRYVEKTFLDKNGVLSSADKGLAIGYDLPGNFANLYLLYMNGEGYKSTEISEFKDIAGRLSLFPAAAVSSLSGLGFHFYYQKGTPADGQVRNRIAGALSYAYQDRMGLMGQYLVSAASGTSDNPKESTGYCFWAWVDIGRFLCGGSFGVLARYDFFDPDNSTDQDANTYLLGGAYYTFAKGWQASLNYRATSFQDPNTKGTDGLLTLNLHAKF